MPKYRAIQNGFARPSGLTFARFIAAGETFEFSGAPGSWMQPLDAEAQANTPARPKRRSSIMHRTVAELGSVGPLPGQMRATTKNEGAIEP